MPSVPCDVLVSFGNSCLVANSLKYLVLSVQDYHASQNLYLACLAYLCSPYDPPLYKNKNVLKNLRTSKRGTTLVYDITVIHSLLL